MPKTDVIRLRDTGLALSELEDLFRLAPARRRLLLLDSCESGEPDAAERAEGQCKGGPPGLHSRALPFAVDQAGDGGKASRRNSFLSERDHYIYSDLARRSGAIVFASSTGAEASYELSSIKGGAFTTAIRAALARTGASSDGADSIRFGEFASLVRPRRAVYNTR